MKKMILTALLAIAAIGFVAATAIAQEATTATSNQGSGAEVTPTSSPATQPAQKSPFDNTFFWVMIAGAVVLFYIMSRSRKKQEAKQKQMLSSLKKGDKVTTIGGIIGTAIEVRDDEVVIKVDENSNTRMKFARWAVRNIGEPGKTDEKK